MSVKVAIAQKPPVLLDLSESIARALETIEEAVAQGANLLVFPEAYLPGYPTWIWRLAPGKDMALGSAIHSKLRENSVDIAAGDLDSICAAAREHKIVIVMGLNGYAHHSTGFRNVAQLLS